MVKIREGFVSNSSTTSFVIYGLHDVVKDDIKNDLLEKWTAQYKEFHTWAKDYTEFDLSDLLEDLGTLEIHYTEAEDLCIGRSIDTMKDDETMGQLKEGVKEELRKILKDEEKLKYCNIVADAYRDG